MTSDRKPSAAFWITVALLVVLVGYPLSFGPACWVTSRSSADPNWISNAYPPVFWLFEHATLPIRGLIFWYATIGGVRNNDFDFDHPQDYPDWREYRL